MKNVRAVVGFTLAIAVVITLFAADPLGWFTADPGKRLAWFGVELIGGNDRAFETQPCVRVLDEGGPLLEVSFRAEGSRVRVANEAAAIEGFQMAVFEETNGEPGRQSPPEQVRSSWGGETADAVVDSSTGWDGQGALPCLEATLELAGGDRVQRVVGPAVGTRPAGAWHLLAWIADRDLRVDWQLGQDGALSLRALAGGEPTGLEARWGSNVAFSVPSGPVVMPASLVGAIPSSGLRATVRVLEGATLRVELERPR